MPIGNWKLFAPELEFTFVDVGQGDCIFIKSDTISETDFQYIDAAAQLGAAGVRVFAGDHVSRGFEHTTKKIPELAEAVRQLCAYAKKKGVEIWLETHSEFSTGRAMELLIREADMDNLKAIWDVIHSLEYGESLEESISHLGGHIAHVHLKDGIAVSGQTEFLHTDLGVGQMPFGAVIRALKEIRYEGFLSLEWESPWRPEIRDLYPDLLVLLNKYTDILRQHSC